MLSELAEGEQLLWEGQQDRRSKRYDPRLSSFLMVWLSILMWRGLVDYASGNWFSVIAVAVVGAIGFYVGAAKGAWKPSLHSYALTDRRLIVAMPGEPTYSIELEHITAVEVLEQNGIGRLRVATMRPADAGNKEEHDTVLLKGMPDASSVTDQIISASKQRLLKRS